MRPPMMIIWILLCVLVGYCADRKGRNMWAWGIASLFLSPLLIGITLALMPDETDKTNNRSRSFVADDDSEEDSEEVRCPECGYLADASEQFCPRCGEMLW